MNSENIRNFSVIAHIDHGKSTLADRMLEITGTIPARKMREQVLDQMELERERGITIKMAPVRMLWHPDGVAGQKSNVKSHLSSHSEYVLNLIDTPGHIDFSYEVSRALKAVEGAILLVDATQGVQAQTLTTLRMAVESHLVIIPVVNKIDAPLARVPEVKEEIAALLHVSPDEILETSGKTGAGVPELLAAVVKRVPPPQESLSEIVSRPGASVVNESALFRSLIFDFQYSNHQGIVVYTRVFDGEVRRGDMLRFCASGTSFGVNEVGVFAPDMRPVDKLSRGAIGYIVTGIKEPGVAAVGDTLVWSRGKQTALPEYHAPAPVVWASLYSESQDDFAALRQALLRLRLSDSSFTFEEEQSGSLGRGFRCGFLGMLHLEIITERVRREFNLAIVVTLPSITYEIEYPGRRKEMVYTPIHFPDDSHAFSVWEPWVSLEIILPYEYLGDLMQLVHAHEGAVADSDMFGDNRVSIKASLPLREMMRNFFDEVKSVSSGFASLSYTFLEMRPANVVRLDVSIADELVPAFSRVVSRARVEEEAKQTVEKLHDLLPRQQFTAKIQARALGRILSSQTLKAFRKDVTAKLYGGDITRKMKLLENQKKGKKKMREHGRVSIPHDVFLKMMRS